MSASGSGGTLSRWYGERIGEPATDDEVRGYWLFVAGAVLAVVGIALFLASTAMERNTATYRGVREMGYAVAALGLPTMLMGFVARLPLRRRANLAAYVGLVVCSIAVLWFMTAFPGAWSRGPDSQAPGIIALYTVGLVVVLLGGIAVPLVTGSAEGDVVGTADRRATDAETRAASAERRAEGAEQSGAKSTGRADDAERRAAALEAELAEIATSQARFELYEDRGGKWRWRLRHRNGNVIADSAQGYASRQKAQQGLRSVQRNALGAPLLQLESEPETPDPAAGPDADVTEAASEPTAAEMAPLGDYESEATFELYEDGAGEHRWRLVHDNGNVLADSGEGYASRQKARQGMRSVRTNAAVGDYLRVSPTAFEVYRDAEGNWRWRLVHRNGNILADSGGSYATRSGARDGVERVVRRAPEEEGAAFTVYEDSAGEFRWRFVHDNGRMLADSGEGYTREAEAEAAVERVQTHVGDADVLDIGVATFEVYEDAGEEWRWRLRHRNGNVIADSGEGFGQRSDAHRSIESVKRTAPGAGDREA